MKRILFVTGTRADFGKLKSLMHAVDSSPKFECYLFVTGMHMLKKYGPTYVEVEKEKFKNIFYFYNQSSLSSQFMDLVLAETIRGISHYLSETEIDLIVVHGDRVEALAAALTGALKGIRVAHIEGGEKSGSIDDSLRHAISKFAHIHFVSTNENKNRLLQLGEHEKSIYIIGSPDIDILLSETSISLDSVKERYDITFDRYSIFIYHPVCSELEVLREKIETAVSALEDSKRNYVVIYPNNDKGSDIILEKLKSLKNNPRFRLFPSVRFEFFVTLIKNADFVIGNSSCGIHEAPVLGVPTINIGTRQKNRFFSKSIHNVTEDKKEILELIEAMPMRVAPVFAYGSGNSAELFLNTLQNNAMWDVPLQKEFHDIK